MAARRPSSAPGDYVEAVEWFRNRTPIRKDVWRTLEDRAQRQAFTVAGVAQLSVIAEVQDSLVKAIRNGHSLETWKKGIRQRLEDEWAGTVQDPPTRLETIFRTNVQMAYAQGRREQMLEPETLRIRPYWRYLATLDNRTTVICQRLDGTTLPATARFWLSHTPPLHFRCRGTIQALTRGAAQQVGLTTVIPKVAAQGGFGGADPRPYQPDLSKVPGNLARLYENKRRHQPIPKLPKVPEPKEPKAHPKAPTLAREPSKPHPLPPTPAPHVHAPPARPAPNVEHPPKAPPPHVPAPPPPETTKHGVRGSLAERVEEHYPELAKAFGPRMRVDHSKLAEEQLHQMSTKLPPHVLAGLGKYIKDLHLGAGGVFRLAPEVDPAAAASGGESRFSKVAGIHWNGKARVIVGDIKVGFSDSTVLHELTHAWDKHLGKLSFQPEWHQAWWAWRRGLDADALKRFNYITRGKNGSEAFAEFGATYLMHGKEAVRKKFGDSPLVDMIEAAYKRHA